MGQLPAFDDPALLVGTNTADDAAVYQVDDDKAIIQTLDFITPVVNDPYTYGQIAAANSLSDVYAMGGRALFALNIVCFPSRKVPMDVLGEILRGGADKCAEAGVPIAGGHSVDDAEPKYGLVVTGIVSPDNILAHDNAQPGDVLVLTKPIGSGIITTALKKKAIDESGAEQAVKVMSTLNKAGVEALSGLRVNAVTDITGFGLLGHLHQMLDASKVSARIKVDQVPVMDSVWTLVRDGVYPGGTQRNLNYVEPATEWASDTDDATKLVLADAQTSGGLLISVEPDNLDELLRRLDNAGTLANAVIGNIEEGPTGIVRVDPSL